MMMPAEPSTPAQRDEGGENVLLPRRRDGAPLKCLIVEDEGLIALDLAARLDEWGADNDIAPTIVAALKMIADMQPDVVLLDVGLPDGNGLDLAAKMRVSSDAAIIFVTGKMDLETLRRIRLLGDFAIVPKPVDFRQLRHTIQDVLAR
jgi:DNA-binding response OmpR family regulator